MAVGEVYVLDQAPARLVPGDGRRAAPGPQLRLPAHGVERAALPGGDRGVHPRGHRRGVADVVPGEPRPLPRGHALRRGRGAPGRRRCCCSACAAARSSSRGRSSGCRTREIPADAVVDLDGRDPERAPIPWEPPSVAGPGAGFTTGTPVAADGRRRRAPRGRRPARRPAGPTWRSGRRLIALRRERPALGPDGLPAHARRGRRGARLAARGRRRAAADRDQHVRRAGPLRSGGARRGTGAGARCRPTPTARTTRPAPSAWRRTRAWSCASPEAYCVRAIAAASCSLVMPRAPPHAELPRPLVELLLGVAVDVHPAVGRRCCRSRGVPVGGLSDSPSEREPAEPVGLEVEGRARLGDGVAAAEEILQEARLAVAEPRQIDPRAAPGEVVDRHDRPALPVAAVGEDGRVARAAAAGRRRGRSPATRGVGGSGARTS